MKWGYRRRGMRLPLRTCARTKAIARPKNARAGRRFPLELQYRYGNAGVETLPWQIASHPQPRTPSHSYLAFQDTL